MVSSFLSKPWITLTQWIFSCFIKHHHHSKENVVMKASVADLVAPMTQPESSIEHLLPVLQPVIAMPLDRVNEETTQAIISPVNEDNEAMQTSINNIVPTSQREISKIEYLLHEEANVQPDIILPSDRVNEDINTVNQDNEATQTLINNIVPMSQRVISKIEYLLHEDASVQPDIILPSDRVSEDVNTVNQDNEVMQTSINNIVPMSQRVSKIEYLPELREEANLQPDIMMPSDRVNEETKHYFTAVACPVTLSTELPRFNKKEGRSTLHLEVDISGSREIKYTTGDNLGILPVNNMSIVEDVAKALLFDLDAVFRFKSVNEKNNELEHLFPTPCTVRTCLSLYCDLVAPLTQSQLGLLANYATRDCDKKALQRFAEDGQTELYKSQILDSRFGIAEVVCNLYPSVVMTFEKFVDFCVRLRPQFYAISSSSSLYPQSVHLTVDIMTGERNNENSRRKGYYDVCSEYFSNMPTDGSGTCRIFIKKSSFRLPLDTAKPILMIGTTSTDIAPMRALLQERWYQKHHENHSVGKTILYFWCEHPDYDNLYEEELQKFHDHDLVTQLHVNFIREGDHKVFVEHLLAQHSYDTWDLIDRQHASIYVCGGAEACMDVAKAITKIVAEVGGKGMDQAPDYMEMLRLEGRLVQELWA